jgi:hypothetical protein
MERVRSSENEDVVPSSSTKENENCSVYSPLLASKENGENSATPFFVGTIEPPSMLAGGATKQHDTTSQHFQLTQQLKMPIAEIVRTTTNWPEGLDIVTWYAVAAESSSV